MKSVKYYDRSLQKTKTEKIPGEGILKFLYHSPFGKIPLEMIFKRKLVSCLMGKFMDSKISKKRIKNFIKDFDIEMNDFIGNPDSFKSFNDFFYRKIKQEKRPIDQSDNSLVSPADGKIIAFENISNSMDFFIKGTKFNLEELIGKNSQTYKDGTMLIIRLCPADYHRFHFPLEGKIIDTEKISGALYSVSPLAVIQKPSLFWENKREVTTIKNDFVNEYLYLEVGATMVGSIINTYSGNSIAKGDEKGYFKFGGSTIILIFQKDKIILDADIIEKSKLGIEVAIKFGEKIGVVR